MNLRILSLCAFLLSIACSGAEQTPFTVGPYRAAMVGDFSILVPITKKQRDKGLKFVASIPQNKGMVVFRMEGKPALLTMVDVPVNVDMVFIARDGAIQKVVPAMGTAPKTDPKTAITYTLQGAVPAAELEVATAKLSPTFFVVEVAAGQGARFVQTWRPEMVERLLHPAFNHWVYGF